MEKGPSILEKEHRNFIENFIAEDLKSGKNDGKIITRFPPEPNGYLHIGHCKAFCFNFGLARDNENAHCNLRFDDTNPEKESDEYVRAIKEDIKWMGFDWEDNLFFASDYFEKLYGFAVELIEKGLAYVDEQSQEVMREQRGNLKTPGTNSPHRDRSIEENLNLFSQMREGKFDDGQMVLRAKIDMAHPNMNMRDPAIYRIRKIHHHRTGDKWCIYPMYDFQHPLSDALEGVTYSLCSLEYEDHRPLYNWFVDNTSVPSKPRQIEFSRLNLDYTMMSKRYLLQLVEDGLVDSWTDPRMPTVSGMRRRGYPAESIRKFMDMIGMSKNDTIIELSVLEGCVRDTLNSSTKRCLGILDPIKVIITNWDAEDKEIDAPFHPQDESYGTRKINFGKELYIDRSDWMDDPPSPKKWYRLGPDRSVRLRYGCVITVEDMKRDESGKVIELMCKHHADSFGGVQPEALEKKVKGIIHWVNAKDAKDVEVRLYDRLFKVESPKGSEDFKNDINENSLEIITAKVEPFLFEAQASEQFQFERTGYFTVDPELSKPGKPVFNRTVTLRDAWQKKK